MSDFKLLTLVQSLQGISYKVCSSMSQKLFNGNIKDWSIVLVLF